MPRFRYAAYDRAGAHKEGEAVAASLEALLASLHEQGLHAYRAEPAAGERRPGLLERLWPGERPLGTGILAQLMRELATLLAADVPLDEALRIVRLQAPRGRPRATVEQVLEKVLDGASLSKAMAGSGGAIPAYLRSAIATGEATGALGIVAEELALFLERAGEVRARIVSALAYPLLLMGLAMAAITMLLLVLVPALAPMFEDAGVPPPLMLGLLMGLRGLLGEHWALLLAGLLALVLAGSLVGRNASFRAARDRLLLGLPLAGGLIASYETARFARLLATLVRSGVPLVDGLQTVRGLAVNSSFGLALDAVLQRVREGSGLAQPLAESKVVPDVAVRLVRVGEETGQLERMLQHVAQIFEAGLQRRLDRLLALLAPALTLAIGAGVGGLILSVMNAILSVNDLAFK